MTERNNLTYLPGSSYTLHQSSSYNRESVSPDSAGWFANNDMSHFLRVEENSGRREFVMLDVNGPGAIVRWWMTFYKAQYGTIRIYIDHDTIPVMQGAPDELLSGNLLAGYPLSSSVQAGAPLQDSGRDYDHNLYAPIPYSRHCKITYECDALVLLYEIEGVKIPRGHYFPDVFYNINYRTYKKGIKVESFSISALNKCKTLLEKAGEELLKNQVARDDTKEFEKMLMPGDSLVVKFTQKHRAVNELVIEIEASDAPQALRSTVLKASFDGYQTIWVPVGEFFGSGYSLNPNKTWMNQRELNGRMSSFWIMPYRDECVFTIFNYGNQEISIKGLAGLTRYKWNNKSMYFGSSWHEYRRIYTRDEEGAHFDLNFINIKGKGLYVGDAITLFNTSYQWWGEGDEKIFVDGESFPSHFGTGTEDYYGYAFARPEPFSNPFISQPEGKGNEGNTNRGGLTVNSRIRSLDAIPFSTSILSNMELWHWAPTYINYALTSYWYVQPPFSINIKPDIESVQHKVAVSSGDIMAP